ncbi:MAG: glutathione S-transferase family protein [Pseudomonadota bacterium]
MQLYSMKQAVNPQRVRIFAAEKGIALDIIEIDIPGGENLSETYLKINPRGLLPALVLDDGTVLTETVAICRYLESLFPEPNLLGSTAKEQALIEMRQREMEFDGLLPISWIFRNTAAHFKTRPQPGAVPDMEQLPGMAARGQVLTSVWLDRLNECLGQHSYVAGERFTIADITAFCGLGFARWVKISVPDGHTHTKRWLAEMLQRPASKA